MAKIVLFILSSLCLALNAQSQLKVGDDLPSVTLKNIKMIDVDLLSLKGKYLLVDFWASWCAPCRKQNKKLKSLFSRLRSEKFEIVGISIDNKVDAWKKAIEKDRILYTQLNDSDGFDGVAALAFGVDTLPTTFLFDKNGVLILINPTEKQIIKLIQ